MWRDSLPAELKAKVDSIIVALPSAEDTLAELYDFLKPGQKKRKTNKEAPPSTTQKATNDDQAKSNPLASNYHLNYTAPIAAEEKIFELSSLSFSSPTRKKFHLVFHLLLGENSAPNPVLSVVNLSNSIPEISLTNLLDAISLSMILPILGNTTIPSKKDTAMLCLWLQKDALLDVSKDEPIICLLNLDVIKKQLMADQKLPPNAEAQIAHVEATDDAIKPINELIIEFLQRQFSLCGINLLNFMPSPGFKKNSLLLNSDNTIALSLKANSVIDFLAVEAYKGSKEGSLLFVQTSPQQAKIIFGFKKPIIIIDFKSVKSVSYKDVTRFTFSILMTLADPNDPENELIQEFSMIDQKSHQAIDDFVRAMNIDDNSFDDKYREKASDANKGAAEEPSNVADTEQQPAGSDDEDEDETYTGGVEGESDSDSDVAEEFDSDANDSGSDGEKSDEESGEDVEESNNVEAADEEDAEMVD